MSRPARDMPPALAVCGFSGSGKTTLLESVIPELVGRGLAVAVVKHDAHGVDVDRPGKDSDRLFRAGATVVLEAPDQQMARVHGPVRDLRELILELGRRHDLVLVEGHARTPLDKVWLLGGTPAEAPAALERVAAVLPRDDDRPRRTLELLGTWLAEAWRTRTLLGGVLLGGPSRRMGRPKQLIEIGGVTLAERTVAALEGTVRNVVVLGGGELPSALRELPRLPDPPGVDGPLAGLIAALRWAPDAAWIVTACDHPRIGAPAVEWLRAQRAPGAWAVIPHLGAGGPQPLLACYEPQARGPLELAVRTGPWSPKLLAAHPKAIGPSPPERLAEAWRDVDTSADLEPV